MQFPTTLSAIAPQGRLVHVYAEFRGRRFYLASEVTFHCAEQRAAEYKAKYPLASLYLCDRSDSTSIDGAWSEMAAVYPN